MASAGAGQLSDHCSSFTGESGGKIQETECLVLILDLNTLPVDNRFIFGLAFLTFSTGAFESTRLIQPLKTIGLVGLIVLSIPSWILQFCAKAKRGFHEKAGEEVMFSKRA